MANNVIRSFLVSLGWDIDQSGMNQFATSIAVQTEAVRVLGEGLEAAARKVIDFATGVAEGMDKLYFSSIRTKSSAANLEALKYAAEQTGGAAESLTAHVQNLNNLLNTRPGYKNWFESLGVQADKTRDRVQILRDFVERTKSMTDTEAYARARTLGIDATELDEMRRPEFGKFFQESQDAQHKAGVDADKGAQKANAWETEMRRLKMQVELFKNGLGAELLGKALPYLQKFVISAVNLVLKLINWWKNLDAQTRTTIKWILAIVAGFAALVAGLTVLGSILGIVVSALEPFFALLGLLLNPVGLLVAAVTALGAAFVFTHFDELMKQMHELVDFINEHLHEAIANAKADWDDFVGRVLKGQATGTPGVPFRFNGTDEAKDKLKGLFLGQGLDGTGGQPRGIRNNNPGNVEAGAFARAHGAVGVEREGRFATFATAQAGLDATAALLASYARRGIDSVQAIIDRYAPAGKDNPDQAKYIEFLAKRLGVSAGAHLNLSDPKTLAALEAGVVQFENGQNPYAPEMYNQAARSALGAGAGAPPITIEQHNSTTINGATDPAAVAKGISTVMRDNNAMLVRALQARIS